MNLFPHQNRLTGTAYGLLVLFCLAVFLPGFFTLPPIDRDEARFAEASKQMLQTGDLVNIRFQDEARNKKPVGIHWLQAGTTKIWQTLSGDKEDNHIWTYRIPSLLSAILAVLLTAMLGSKLFNTEIGFTAAILLASSFLLNVEARLATTDAALLAAILGCQFVLAKAFIQSKPLKHKDFFLFWLSLAAGFLIKGPLILLAPLGTVITLKILKEDIGFTKKLKCLWGIPFALLLILPWYVLITLSTSGAFVAEAGGNDFLAKIWQGQNWGIGLPGLHAIAMPVTFWPASLPFLLAIPFIWASRHDKPFRFCIAWALPIWIIFELTSTKLPHYALPCFPALALLTSAWIYSGVRECNPRWWNKLVFIGLALVTLGIAALNVALPISLEGTLFYGALFMGALALGAILAANILFQQQKNMLAIAPLPVAGFAMMLALFGFLLPNLPHTFMSIQIMNALPQLDNCAKPLLITAGYNEESLVFLAGKETKMLNNAEWLQPILKDNPCAIAIVEDDQKQRFDFSNKDAGIKTEQLAHIDGFNYSNGRASRLGMYRRVP